MKQLWPVLLTSSIVNVDEQRDYSCAKEKLAIVCFGQPSLLTFSAVLIALRITVIELGFVVRGENIICITSPSNEYK